VINFFAAEEGPAVHIAPGGVFEIGGVTITNSILYGWISAVVIILFLVWASKKVKVKPQRGIVQLVEVGVDFISSLVMNAFDDKRIARKYVPFFVTLFFFILLNNWLGLLPLVGEGFKSGDNPLFRPFTGDLNATFGIGIVTMLLVYGASIKEAGGLRNYLGHFFIGSPLNPLYFIIGLIELFTDLTRVLSLSLRLFLNIAIGEIVIAVFAYLGSTAAPLTALPFFLLELGVAALQAYIFTLLSIMYLAISVNSTNHAHDKTEKDLISEDVPETILRRTAKGSIGG
jgi:F-type H+-transporting ATPase subunit a